MGSLRITLSTVLLSLFLFNQCVYGLSVQFNVDSSYRGKGFLVFIVDQSGRGNFTKVQDAVNSVPTNNRYWVYIRVRAGVYNEKVVIPANKPYIVLEGDGREITVIQSAGGGEYFKTAAFSLFASRFVARRITFKNIHDHWRNFMQAPAAVISGDKAAFFDCGFISVQDTLTDSKGRHYFQNCYIQGAVDFIWGDGQSIYQGCTIYVTYDLPKGANVAYITAQARQNANSRTGFVFIECSVAGTVGRTYLGRAYTSYSRVLFYRSHLDGLIAQEGWEAWNADGHEKDVVFAEEGCTGPGADTSKRVGWEKRLGQQEVESLVNPTSFINHDRWLNMLPGPLVT